MRRGLWGSVLAALVALAACGGDDGDGTPSAAQGSSEGGSSSITIAYGAEPTTLDPHIADDGGERAVNDNVYETLVARDASGELVPGLAAELPEQVDETTWRFQLREGVTFHDGTPFDAEAVVATVERVIELGAESEQAGFYSTFAGAEAVEDYIVDLTTTSPDPILPARSYWLKIMKPGAADEPGFAEDPVGTGPYTFERWDRGQQVVLRANPDHRDGPPIDEVSIRFVAESGTRLAGLLSGEYDVITNLAPEDVDRAPQAAAVLGLEHPLVTLDADDGITSDVRVRQALNHAVDKQALATDLFQGFAEVDTGQAMAQTHFGFNPDLEPYPYDPERAQKLLAEADAEGASIQLIGASGRWLKDQETVEAVAGYWQEVGLDVDVQILEFGAWLDAWSERTVRPDSIFLNSSNELFDADRTLSALFHPEGIGSSNSDEQLGNLIDRARVETDTDAREELYHEAFALAYDEAYFVYLLHVEDSYGMSDRVVWEPRVDAKLIVAEMSLDG